MNPCPQHHFPTLPEYPATSHPPSLMVGHLLLIVVIPSNALGAEVLMMVVVDDVDQGHPMPSYIVRR